MVVVLAVIAVLVGAGVAWNNGLRDRFFVRNFGVVDAGKVYRSGRLTTSTLGRLRSEYHIKTVIDLGAFEPGSAADTTEADAAAHLGMERVVLRLYGDGTGNPNAYVEALRIMHDPGKQPVLVHCSAGAQRTGVAVMLYRNLFEGVPIETAYLEAQHYRHDPARNKVLLPYVKEWHDRIEAAVKSGDGALIPGVPPANAETPASVPGMKVGGKE